MALSTLDRIRAINNHRGVDTRKQAHLNEVQWNIARHFADSTDYHAETMVDENVQRLLVINHKDDSKKKIIAYPGESFAPGQIVDCFNAKWLITNVDVNMESICRGDMQRCNCKLKWQNLKTGEFVERWCIAERPYSDNKAEVDDVFEWSHRQFKIQVPYDDETKLIDLDRRFMVEVIDGRGRTYKVVSVDTVSKRYEYNGEFVGFLVWFIRQDQFNEETDSTEYQVCDYFVPTRPQKEDDTDDELHARIYFKGKPEFKIGGTAKELTAEFFTTHKKTGEDIPVEQTGVWSIVADPAFDGLIHLEPDGNKVLVSVDDDSSMDYASVKIVFSSEDEACVVSTTFTIVEVI